MVILKKNWKVYYRKIEVVSIVIKPSDKFPIVTVEVTIKYEAPHFLGAGCSKLTTSLVNVSLKFQMLISEIYQYFLLEKCEKLLQCKCFFHFFQQKFQCIWL